MFDKRNFCHVASNNRNEQKAGIFVYKTTDDLQTVLQYGYFNEKIIDINLHDLIIHVKRDAVDRTKVERNLLCVVERTLDDVGTILIKSNWEKTIEETIADIQTIIDSLDDTYVRIDGTSIMTAPLKFMSGSVRGAVGPYFNGVGFWKLDSQGNLTQIASISDSQFIPTTTNATDIGNSTKKWKDLYLSGKAYVGTINNGYDISVPAYAGTMVVADFTSVTAGQILALDSDLKPVWQNAPTIPTVGDGTITITQGGTIKGIFTVNQSGNTTIDLDAGGSGSGADLFDWKWADHELDDMAWLRADTFSWQSGSVYQAAYKHLRNDMYQWYSWENNGTTIYTKKAYPEVGENVYSDSALTTEFGEITDVTDTLDITVEKITVNGVVYDSVSGSNISPTTETVGGVTVQYIPAEDGHKIVTDFHESEVADVYTATGVAWYYIIDYGFKRFKLPRTKFGMTGLRDAVGKYVEAGLPNITAESGSTSVFKGGGGTLSGAFIMRDGTNEGVYGSGGGTYFGVDFDASLSNSIYGNSTTVQPPATQMYLYFYVGNFTQSAIENTAGINTEDFNNKVDTDFGNTNMIDYVVAKQEPNAGNGYTWYRKYKSGWVEQGGIYTISSSSFANFNLIVPMSDTNYTITGNSADTTSAAYPLNFNQPGFTTTTFSAKTGNSGSGKFIWRAEGVAA